MEMVTSKVAWKIAAGVCGALFLGYCIYFDHKRHQDPDFKKKLRARRKAKKLAASKKQATVFPDLRDHEAVQRFFLQEIQLGEELLVGGDVENGVDHFVNAIAVCGQPNDVLNLLQKSLPPQVFYLIIQRVATAPPRIVRAAPTMQEDDVE